MRRGILVLLPACVAVAIDSNHGRNAGIHQKLVFVISVHTGEILD